MESTKTFKDQWFPVAIARAIKGEIYQRCLFGQKVILFRDSSGTICCLKDQCSHMRIPLSDGKIKKGLVECCYHGWTYNGEGQCTHIPRLNADSSKVQAKACVPKYPVQILYGMVWIYLGHPQYLEPLDVKSEILEAQNQNPYFNIRSLTHYEFPSHYSIASLNAFDFSHVHIHAFLKRVLPVSSGHYRKTHIEGQTARTTFIGSNNEEVEVVMQRSPILQITFRNLSRIKLGPWLDLATDLQVFGSPIDKDRSFLFAFPVFRGRPRFLFKLIRPIVDWVLHFSFAEDIEIFKFQQAIKNQGTSFYNVLSPLDASWIKVHHWLQSFDETALYEEDKAPSADQGIGLK